MGKKAPNEVEREANKKIQKEIANRIKERRKSLNYTQEQFAELIGITTSSYTRIENAFQKPALNTLIKISLNLKVSLDYIVFGNDSSFTNPPTDMEMLTTLLDFSDIDKIRHVVDILNKIIKIKS